MAIFDDLEAEQDRLEGILSGLGDGQWMAPSGADGWTVSDVVLHLAQSEEAVVASATGASAGMWPASGAPVDAVADELVQAERAQPGPTFERWRTARRGAVAALRAADADQPLPWVVGTIKPATLATTRLAEHWAHGLDITEPLGIALPDTDRLNHIAWLAHRTLPYAFTVAGQRAEIQGMIDSSLAQGVPRLFLVEEEYRLALLDAEVAFVERFIAQITDPETGWGPAWAAAMT